MYGGFTQQRIRDGASQFITVLNTPSPQVRGSIAQCLLSCKGERFLSRPSMMTEVPSCVPLMHDFTQFLQCESCRQSWPSLKLPKSRVKRCPRAESPLPVDIPSTWQGWALPLPFSSSLLDSLGQRQTLPFVIYADSGPLRGPLALPQAFPCVL